MSHDAKETAVDCPTRSEQSLVWNIAFLSFYLMVLVSGESTFVLPPNNLKQCLF